MIKHIIPVDIGDGEKLIINSLNGLIDKIDNSIFEMLSKWRDCDEIIPKNDLEISVYDYFKPRGYFINSYEEEMAQKNALIDRLRENHLKKKDSREHVVFLMTYECNFRCSYCYEGEHLVKRGVITPAMIDAALDFAGEDLAKIGLVWRRAFVAFN